MLMAVSVVFASCEISSGFLSESERSSLYTLSLSTAEGGALSDGALVLPGTEIAAVVARKSGAADLGALDFVLSNEEGGSSASLRLVAPSGKALGDPASKLPGSGSRSVASIEGRLAGFKLPQVATPGLYELSASIVGLDGVVLQKKSAKVFIGSRAPVIGSVSTFPAPVEPSSAVLLELSLSSLPLGTPASGQASGSGYDPWIRWSKDGSSFADGLLSEGLDKVVWSAPRAEGAYSILVEVFPAAPRNGSSFAFPSLVKQELKVMVIATPGGSGNDFADPLAFYSLLKLEGSFDDVGTRPRRAQPERFGTPALDTYSSGFGYRFGSSAGVAIPGLMPPGSEGRLGAFSALIRLDSDKTEGTLLSFASDDGSWSLVLGIKDSRPYVETKAEGKVQRSSAESAIPGYPLTLEATLRPTVDRVSISWHAEGELLEAPSLPLPPLPPPGSARLGGEGSLPGVYDGFGLMVNASSPAYRLAARRKWKAALVIAESFEDGALPPLSVATGSVAPALGSISLEPGASLALAPSFAIPSSLRLEADIEGDRSSCLLVLSDSEHARVVSVSGSGEVADSGAVRLGSLDQPVGRLSFLLEQEDGNLFIRSAEGSRPLVIPTTAKRFTLSLAREGGSGAASFSRVLLRSSLQSAARK